MKTLTKNHALIILTILAFIVPPVFADGPMRTEWVKRIDTGEDDRLNDMAVDSQGNVIITGYIYEMFLGERTGNRNPFLAKYDPSGHQLWFNQLGTSGNELSKAVAIGPYDDIHITGDTIVNFDDPSLAQADAFTAKYSSTGNSVWITQSGSGDTDFVRSIAVDAAGNSYITGSTLGDFGATNAGEYDIFLAKYDSAGSQLWARQLGTSIFEESHDITLDPYGNIFVAGLTAQQLKVASGDSLLAKYDTHGNLQWTRQLGTAELDVTTAVAADASGVYITGLTSGDLAATNLGSPDVFLAKYDLAGNLLWTRQTGSDDNDAPFDMTLDQQGNVYIAGQTWGEITGESAGLLDAFLIKYDSTGQLVWTEQMGTDEFDIAHAVDVDNDGNVYISGDVGGKNGIWDAFVAKYYIPEQCGTENVGDFNCDGYVGLLDLDILGQNWNKQGAIGSEGDTNGDGYVDLADLDTLGANWQTQVIPEPATLLLLMASMMPIRRRR